MAENMPLQTRYDDRWMPRCLTGLAMAFLFCVLVSNVWEPKIFEVYGFTLTGGLLLFPFSMILGDVITEVYGVARTRRVLFISLALLIVYGVGTQLIVAIPPSADWGNQAAFEAIFGQTSRIILGSLLAYMAGELTNAYVLAWMKARSGGKYFGRRAIASTVLGQGVDSVVFFPIAFGGLVPMPVLFEMFAVAWVFKVGYEIVALPLTSFVVRKVKALEGVEHFDFLAPPNFPVSDSNIRTVV